MTVRPPGAERGIRRAAADITVGYGHDSTSAAMMPSGRGVLKAVFFAAGTHPLHRSRPHAFAPDSPEIPCIFLPGYAEPIPVGVFLSSPARNVFPDVPGDAFPADPSRNGFPGNGRRLLTRSGRSGRSGGLHSPRPPHTPTRPAPTRPAPTRPARARPARIRWPGARPVRAGRVQTRTAQARPTHTRSDLTGTSVRQHDAGTPPRRWLCCHTAGSASGHVAAPVPTPDAFRVHDGTVRPRSSNYGAWSCHA